MIDVRLKQREVENFCVNKKNSADIKKICTDVDQKSEKKILLMKILTKFSLKNLKI